MKITEREVDAMSVEELSALIRSDRYRYASERMRRYIDRANIDAHRAEEK